MKRCYNTLLTVVSILALAAAGCKSEDPVRITVNPESIAFPGLGGVQTLTVESNADWIPMPDATWLVLTKLNATDLKIEATPNTTFYNRSAIVRCMAGSTAATITVSQTDLTARQVDSLALFDLYRTANGDNWHKKWLHTNPITQWQGVTIANGRVVSLSIPNNNLSGPLPESIGYLTALQYLDLSGNQFTGTVPASINQLTQLTYLDLFDNNFSGAFPAINALTRLVVFDISSNAFTALPALNMLMDLVFLAFHDNKITGNLPGNLSALTKLIYLDGSINSFSGNIPSAWSTLTNMEVFFFYQNNLDGNIPAYITSYTALQKLALDGNNLTGSIPAGLGSLPMLNELWLAHNRLNGAIHASILSNPHWIEWEPNVCPQQSGYGFGSDCSGSKAPAVPNSAVAKQMKKSLSVIND